MHGRAGRARVGQENPSRLGDDPLDLPYGALYTPRARAIVDAAWGVDADLFGYPFRDAS